MTFKGIGVFHSWLGYLASFVFFSAFYFLEGLVCLTPGVLGRYFLLDGVGFFLGSVSLILGVSVYSWWGLLSTRCRVMLYFSIFMSFVCYFTSHVLVFWVSYELCILPLLFLLVSESSYSERFVAFWYLLGYVVLTSLPMILSIVYIYGCLGGFGLFFDCLGTCSLSAVFVLCVCFITKIPLPPFHVWLPIVHAEASSPVSVCLSGFIMKLGILGVVRFAFNILPYQIFCYPYVSLIFCSSVLFLLLSSQELDGKRWLAILSLSHIVLAALGLMVVFPLSNSIPLIYCLSHGLSAGFMFIFLWLMYDAVGSRNWNVLKFGVGGSLFSRFLMSGGLCAVASFPPTLGFFSEVRLLLDSNLCSFLLLFLFFFYLFFSGLVPLIVLGGCLSRHFIICSDGIGVFLGSLSSSFLLFFSFAFFLIL